MSEKQRESDLNLSRRDFLKLGTCLAAGFGLSGKYGEVMAQGLETIFKRPGNLVWVQGQSCSGCSVSFLNAESPDPLEILTRYISLVFHQTVGAAQGYQTMEILKTMENGKPFFLVVEGAIPLGMPEACTIGGQSLLELLPPLLEKASGVIAAGTCAAFGGIPAAEGNQTGAVGVRNFMESIGMPVKGRLVNCPSCPVHPTSLVGTIAYLAGYGYPPVDESLLTPDMFYNYSTHDECPRFHYWEEKHFAEHFGDQEGCLFKLGCLGPLSHTNCPRRQWNGGVNWCIRAAAPCIACSSESFSKKKDFPFYRKGEAYHGVKYEEKERQKKVDDS